MVPPTPVTQVKSPMVQQQFSLLDEVSPRNMVCRSKVNLFLGRSLVCRLQSWASVLPTQFQNYSQRPGSQLMISIFSRLMKPSLLNVFTPHRYAQNSNVPLSRRH